MALPGSQPDVDIRGTSSIERHLFVAGCPRSGTSALAFLLNEHPQVALGFERFKRVRATLDPFHFTPGQFFAPVLAETDIRGERLYERLFARWQTGSVSVIGDKVPLYTRVLPQLFERFPDARVVVLLRDPLDVARSFGRRASDPEDWWPAENDHRLALEMWNEALDRVRGAEREGYGEQVFLLPYEPFFAGEESWLTALLAFIGLPESPRLRVEFRRLAKAFSERAEKERMERDRERADRDRDRADRGRDLPAYVAANRDAGLAEWARGRTDAQLVRMASSGGARADDGKSAGDDEPLAAEELEEHEQERRELLEEMRRPGRRGEQEVEILERRLLEQSGELVRRAQLARAANRS